jgi:hypothetical protein
MNERIKELARQAGFVVELSVNADRQIKRFAELVRQDERERFAKMIGEIIKQRFRGRTK